jgi:hypothetical protein
MGRIMVPGLGKKFARPPLNGKKWDVVLHACHSSASGELKIGGSPSGSAWAESETLSPQYPEEKGL